MLYQNNGIDICPFYSADAEELDTASQSYVPGNAGTPPSSDSETREVGTKRSL